MDSYSEEQSLESKVIKILRITNEPLSAHALSETYNLSYQKVKSLLKRLAEDGIVYALKTNRGNFYFIPDRYFKRQEDMLDSEEKLPFVWYEEFSTKELEQRKKKILDSINRIIKDYKKEKITPSEFFKYRQEKNEELFIIEQIIEDRTKKKSKNCFYCNKPITGESILCKHCKKQIPQCSVCKRNIYSEEKTLKCPKCKAIAHSNHLLEWLKSIGSCPICKEHLLKNELLE